MRFELQVYQRPNPNSGPFEAGDFWQTVEEFDDLEKAKKALREIKDEAESAGWDDTFRIWSNQCPN